MQVPIEMRFDVAAYLLNQIRLHLGHESLIGMTAPTGTIARIHSFLWEVIKDNILPAGMTRGTGGSTIDASRANSRHKSPISLCISCHDSIPALIFIQLFLVDPIANIHHDLDPF